MLNCYVTFRGKELTPYFENKERDIQIFINRKSVSLFHIKINIKYSFSNLERYMYPMFI